MSASNFYRAFEEQHRGSRELIQSRQEVYLPFVRGVAQLHPDAPVTDVGCGRGEWLELLQQNGIRGQGVDMDEGMLAACRERNLDVRNGDAIAFLKQLPGASQAAVSGFHIAEHLPFETLQHLVSEAFRVLRPGGLLILETPNPENLAVGTAGFYMDPTHERPLPAPLLAFLPEFYGFGRVTTLRLQESRSLHGNTPVTLEDVLSGVSPDYAVVAQKPVDASIASHPALTALDEAFAQEHGVSLSALAQRHEQQWQNRMRHAEGVAEAARRAALANHSATSQAVQQVKELHHKVLTDMLALQNETLNAQRQMMDAQREVLAVRASTSWRITRPMRWMVEQWLALRQQGPIQRSRRLASTIVRSGLRVTAWTLERHPAVRRLAGGVLRLLGLKDFALALRKRFVSGSDDGGAAGSGDAAPASPETGPMTPEARQVHGALKRAIAARGTPAQKKE